MNIFIVYFHKSFLSLRRFICLISDIIRCIMVCIHSFIFRDRGSSECGDVTRARNEVYIDDIKSDDIKIEIVLVGYVVCTTVAVTFIDATKKFIDIHLRSPLYAPAPSPVPCLCPSSSPSPSCLLLRLWCHLKS